jgi:prepilin-type N-terminal cleavage/methylation domain-containing protein
MVSLKQRQSGFTIVELLIVIVIIGILATLVIVTFSGVQQRARDSERKTDINAIAGQLEAVYAKTGTYPTLAQLNDNADGGWQDVNEFRLDDKAFADPSNPSATDLGTAATSGTTATYGYVPTGCAGSGAAESCTGYTLSSDLEQTGAANYTRSSN